MYLFPESFGHDINVAKKLPISERLSMQKTIFKSDFIICTPSQSDTLWLVKHLLTRKK